MLDLGAPTRTVRGVDLASDDRDPTIRYVLPPPPRVVVQGGVPEVQLLRLVRSGELQSGILRLAVELSHPEALLGEVVAALREEAKDERITLRALPAVGGEAELVLAGRVAGFGVAGSPGSGDGGDGELLHRSMGVVTSQLDAPYRAVLALPLDRDGVRFVEAALRSGGAPIGVTYHVQIEGLRAGNRVVARIDWSRTYEHLSTHFRRGSFFAIEDLRKLVERLVEEKVISIEAVQAIEPEPGETPADLSAALAWVEREIVERYCEPWLSMSREPARVSLGEVGELFGVGADFAVKDVTQIERAVASVDLSRRAVVVRTLTSAAHLSDLLGGAAPEAHITDVGPGDPFFDRVTLSVRTARPLAEVFVREVLGRFTYGTASETIRLTPETPEGSASAWADAASPPPEGGSALWRLDLDVTLEGDAPEGAGTVLAGVASVTGRGRQLTLDLEALLGLRRIEIEGPSDPKGPMTRVRLSHKRASEARGEIEAVLTPDAPKSTMALRDVREGDVLEAHVEHLLDDGRLITTTPRTVDTRVLRIGSPLARTMTIELIADDFRELSNVIVAVQKSALSPTGTFVLEKPGALVPVALPLDGPGGPADRTFRYRAARTFTDGTVEEDEWVTTDVPLVLVGRVAASKLVVEVTPLGPELPEAGIVAIEVELSYVDAENLVRAEGTLVIRARADRPRWEIAIKDPKRRAYEYRVTVHRASGASEVGRFTPSSERLLIVPITR